jgi:hypothetical protein
MARRKAAWVLLLLTAAVPVAAEGWDYGDLDHVLGRYVDEEGFVDYHGLAQDHARLDRYVEEMARVSPDSDPDRFPTTGDALAYWINAYNALMLRRVVEAWPVASVRDIRALYGVFWRDKHRLGGRKLSLRGLENQIIRERFAEPRIHFAINCASRGCPALSRKAWRAETLEADLDAAARRFIANESNVRFDPERRLVELSSIFRWFDGDFIAWMESSGFEAPRGVLDYVLRYLPAERREAWGDPDDLRVEWIDYDWSINVAQDPGHGTE